MSHYDLSTIADLVRAGERLGIKPVPGEDPIDFARRIAEAVNERRHARNVEIAVRAGVSLVLLSFGITVV